MALTKYKLGDLLVLKESRNLDLVFGPESVRGVNNQKQLMPTKVDISHRDLTKFQVVFPGEFVFNHRTSRNGDKFSIAYNDENKPIICTEDYVVFSISEKGKDVLLAEWLYVFFNRAEFDRYVITNSWGSSTEFYNWDDLCSVEINLPPLAVQQKYVAIYEALLANQKSYEEGLNDLKTTVDAILDKEKYVSNKVPVGELLEEVD